MEKAGLSFNPKMAIKKKFQYRKKKEELYDQITWWISSFPALN